MTGGSGFLGRAVIGALSNAGQEIFAVVRPGRQAPPPDSCLIELDLVAPFEVGNLPLHVDAVLHLAQSRHYKDFPDGAPDMFGVNVAATARLLEYALRAKASIFLLASTGSVYAASAEPLPEAAPTATTIYYAASKIAAEALARPYADRLAVCILRFFSLYGPGQSAMLVANLIERIRAGETVSLPMAGDGPRFSPTFVEDAAAAVQAATEEGWEGTYNLAAPQTVSLRELADAIGQALGTTPRYQRAGGQASTQIIADLTRLAERYDMGRFRSLADGLRLTIGGRDSAA